MEEEDDDDIYAPEDAKVYAETEVLKSLKGPATLNGEDRKPGDLEEGEQEDGEEDEEEEEDESDSVALFNFVNTHRNLTTFQDIDIITERKDEPKPEFPAFVQC